MRAAGDAAHGRRLRGPIVILWRAGPRSQEALALTEGDLYQRRDSVPVRQGRAPSRGRHRHTKLGELARGESYVDVKDVPGPTGLSQLWVRLKPTAPKRAQRR